LDAAENTGKTCLRNERKIHKLEIKNDDIMLMNANILEKY